MPIATNYIHRSGLNTLRQAPIALLITRRRILVVVCGASEKAHVVADGTGPVVLEAAPVIPVEACLGGDGVGEGDISL